MRLPAIWSNSIFQFRNYLAGLPLIFVLLTAGVRGGDWILWTTAILICVTGVALRTWAARHCNYSRGKKMHLAQTGPYAYVRNPLYLGNILIIAGAGVATGLAWLVPLSVAWSFTVYLAATAHEQSRLLVRYGDGYRRYRIEVPAWIPRKSPVAESRRSLVASRQIVDSRQSQKKRIVRCAPRQY